MSLPPLSEAEIIAARQYNTAFEGLLTKFSKINLSIALVGTVFGAGLHIALKYFEKTIDDFDNRPDSFTQKAFTHLTTASEMLITAGLYVGIQGFLVSQILNIGYYICYGRGAIYHSQVLTLSLT